MGMGGGRMGEDDINETWLSTAIVYDLNFLRQN